MSLKIWFIETRPQFLILSLVLAFLGTAIGWYHGYFHLGYAILAGFGLLLTHISVNTLNDYFDFNSGIDLNTSRTPFSGGSGVLPAGLLTQKQVLWLGTAALLLAVPVGIFFINLYGWRLMPLLIIAALCIVVYTPLILKTRLPEWAAGLGLGTLPVLGIYFAQTGQYDLPVIIASIPSGLLVYNLLLLNEFPDAEADRTAGRRTAPITLGYKKAALLYSATTALVYIWVVGAVIAGQMPGWSLLALLTLPLAIRAIRGSFRPDDMSRLVPAMADNVLVVLATQLMLGIGYILAATL